ncbi:MAG: phosphoribosylanthranilate isomerase [Myxococcota bacterium]
MTIWVKICGVRTPKEALAIADMGADALGINLWSGSPRGLAPRTARQICTALREAYPAVERIGVTVNHADQVDAYAALVADVGLTAIQLHGDEPMTLMTELVEAGVGVVRALRIAPGDARSALSATVARCLDVGVRVLLDARVPGTYGGTGRRLDSALLHALLEEHALIAAGGLTPDNVGATVAAALEAADQGAGKLLGVDVASGVENDQGRKDLGAVQRFLDAARRPHRSHAAYAPQGD